jgi:hypothetical protein
VNAEPRRWDAPPEPADVSEVADKYGCSWKRRPNLDGWWADGTLSTTGTPWSEMFWVAGPLTEARP